MIFLLVAILKNLAYFICNRPKGRKNYEIERIDSLCVPATEELVPVIFIPNFCYPRLVESERRPFTRRFGILAQCGWNPYGHATGINQSAGGIRGSL